MSFENWNRFVHETIAMLNNGEDESELHGSNRKRTGKQRRRFEGVGESPRIPGKATNAFPTPNHSESFNPQ